MKPDKMDREMRSVSTPTEKSGRVLMRRSRSIMKYRALLGVWQVDR
jgi:hypothetical protein